MSRKHVVEQLQKQLKTVKAEASMIHAECYKVLNEPNPYGFHFYQEYMNYQEEEAAIHKLFKKDGDIVELFDNYMNGIYSKQNARKQQLDALHHEMDLLGIGENSGGRSLKVIVTDAKNIIDSLRTNFTAFKDESLAQLRKAKKSIQMIIDYRKKDAEKKIAILDDYEKRLVQKFGNSKEKAQKEYEQKLAARKMISEDVFHENYLQEDKDIEVSRKTYKKLLPFKERLIKFTAKFDILMNQLDILNLDIMKLEKQVTQLKTQKEEMKKIRASQLYNKFSSMIVKNTRQEEALDEALQKIEERKAKLMPRIEKEREIANRLVPGTNKTVRQLRSEIHTLIHQIGQETLDKTKYIQSINNAEKTFSTASDKMIEELEAEVRNKK